MGNNVEIRALAVESPNSHRIEVLTEWILEAGKVADIINVKDDLANNCVNVEFDIHDGDNPQSKRLTTINIQNPVSSLDPNHKVFVYAHEAGKATISDDMETGNAHGN